MSNERSPRAVCSTTMGTSGICASDIVQLCGCITLPDPQSFGCTFDRGSTPGGLAMTQQIERDLRLPAPTPEVWAALTDPALLEQWLADEVELHLRPGGDARFRSGAIVREGWVEEVLPPRSETGSGRLAFWWA